MTAARAAVEILKREGVTDAFGVPGAAINPFYAALKASGGIDHTLARHVEGASHMAEGYTRTHPGNIGVCVGTSGPAGTDMITGLYSATGDSVPILCITGQAPTAVIHKEDFQAVDIASIAGPVTKMAVTVLEAAQVPGVFQQAFHLMRSGRPGPVLIDLPIDVQLTEIEFDPETYEPLPAFKPAATRPQIEKALAFLNGSERPLIVAGGGAIDTDAERRPGGPADLAPPRQRGPQVRPRRHRAHPDRPDLRPGPRHRLRREGRPRALRRGGEGAEGGGQAARPQCLGGRRAGEEGLSKIAGAQMLHVFRPCHWINCGQAGPLGWTVPAALGVARPTRRPSWSPCPGTTTSSSCSRSWRWPRGTGSPTSMSW